MTPTSPYRTGKVGMRKKSFDFACTFRKRVLVNCPANNTLRLMCVARSAQRNLLFNVNWQLCSWRASIGNIQGKNPTSFETWRIWVQIQHATGPGDVSQTQKQRIRLVYPISQRVTLHNKRVRAWLQAYKNTKEQKVDYRLKVLRRRSNLQNPPNSCLGFISTKIPNSIITTVSFIS